MVSNAFSSCPGATHTRPCNNLSPSPTCSQVILSWMETKRRKLIWVWLGWYHVIFTGSLCSLEWPKKILLFFFKALKDMRRTNIPHYRGVRPHHKGRNCMNFGVFGTKRAVHNRNYPSRSASADNNLLDLLNSSYPTQPHSLIAN